MHIQYIGSIGFWLIKSDQVNATIKIFNFEINVLNVFVLFDQWTKVKALWPQRMDDDSFTESEKKNMCGMRLIKSLYGQ